MVRRLYQELKNIYHFFQALGWRWWYGRPELGMKLYGVTGTNGKTTTGILLGTILREAYGREKVGLITTIAFWLGEEEQVNETKMTTMKSHDVYKLLRQMKDRGVEKAVLEITSHALDQNRLAGIELDGAIILNIAREHLDYHESMRAYARAKGKIVSSIKEGGVLIFKADDELIKKEILESMKVKKCIVEKRIEAGGFTREEAERMETSLKGDWNKENVIAASLLARGVGVKEQTIKTGADKVTQVAGRMELVEVSDQRPGGGNLPRVLIDYAVTPDALEQLYKEVRKMTQGKIFGVLGACGQRDRGKRPIMARVVARYADELVLTREDPWEEDEEQIFRDLEKGLEQEVIVDAVNNSTAGHKRYFKYAALQRIADRREAIKYCIDKAGLLDVVVVTGKGAETGMAVGKEIVPWNDKEEIFKLLKEKKN